MLGFQYMVAKSRELTSKLDRELSAAAAASAGGLVGGSSAPRQQPPASSAASVPSSVASSSAGSHTPTGTAPLSPRNEGRAFLRAQHQQYEKVLASHRELVHSGEELATALTSARSVLQAQAASEQFLAQNFHLVARVRQQLAGVRGLVHKLAEDAEDVEQLLSQRCEEAAARQNAAFAERQQQELERFEQQIAQESEGRKREILEARRRKLARAFQEDLKTYQTLVAYHGDNAAGDAVDTGIQETTGAGAGGKQEPVVASAVASNVETLDSIDLVVTTDADQLEAFYDSGSDEEEKMETPKFDVSPVPAELEEDEEEKSEEKAAAGMVVDEEQVEVGAVEEAVTDDSEGQGQSQEKPAEQNDGRTVEDAPVAAETAEETVEAVEEDAAASVEVPQEPGSKANDSDTKEVEEKP